MLPLPLQTRRMPKLDLMDLIEQGFGQDLSLYSRESESLCQIHKYKQTNTEFMMFSEDYGLHMYARRHKDVWLIYSRDPSDSQFDPQNPIYTLKLEKNLYKLTLNTQTILLIRHIQNYDPLITYNQTKALLTYGMDVNDFDGENVPNNFTYICTIPPIYDSKNKRWYMQDCDRILYPSKRNFLLGSKKCQFLKMGKIGKGAYIVDYKPPLSFAIAFAIALSTCEWKSRQNNE